MSKTLENRLPKALSGYALKYFAMAFMVCDHAALLVIRRGVWAPYSTGLAGDTMLDFSSAPAWMAAVSGLYTVLDVLGHAAFPIFCFLLAEGFTHTRSRRRYLGTLALFALLSEPIYDFAHYGVFLDGSLQNVIFTLTVSCAQLWVLEAVGRRFSDAPAKRAALWVLTMAAAGGLALLVRGEYVFLGTCSTALFYLLRGRGLWRLAGIAPLVVASPWTLLAAPLLALYSGRRGRRGWKYFFYVFYPVHFLILLELGKFFAKL